MAPAVGKDVMCICGECEAGVASVDVGADEEIFLICEGFVSDDGAADK